MTTNRLLERDDLVPLDYEPLLDWIREALATHDTPLFEFGAKQSVPYLQLMVDTVARQLARKPLPKLPLGVAGSAARSATTYVRDTAHFSQAVTRLAQVVEDHLERAAARSGSASLTDALDGLISPLSDFDQAPAPRPTARIGLDYPFSQPQPVTRQRVRVSTPGATPPLLRLHKLTIAVSGVAGLEAELVQALERHVESLDTGDPTLQEELGDIAQDLAQRPDSDVHKLCDLIERETIGRLKREGIVQYVEYLTTTLPTYRNEQVQEPEGLLLVDLAERLRLLEAFVHSDEWADGEVSVSYAGARPLNLQVALARSEVLDALPIIGKIAGTLGETTDSASGNRTFYMGLQLKFGGTVTREQEQPDSFEYHLSLIDPDHERHQRGLATDVNDYFHHRVLVRACVYYLALSQLGRRDYDPVEHFTTHFLPRLASGDRDQARQALREMVADLRTPAVHANLTRLARWMKSRLRAPQRAFPAARRTRYLSVQRHMLLQDPVEMLARYTLFHNVFLEDDLRALRYLRLSDTPVATDALATLPVTFTIENHHFHGNGAQETFAMTYDASAQAVLPLLLVPGGGSLQEYIARPRGLVVVYHPMQLQAWRAQGQAAAVFVYKFVCLLLTYAALRVVLARAPRAQPLFTPLLRFHVHPLAAEDEGDQFWAAAGHVLAHTLSQQEALAASQGFDLTATRTSGKGYEPYKLRNALSSLYAALPKTFTLPRPVTLERLAIIVVSTRECDRARSGTRREVLLYGEVVGIDARGKTAQIRQLATLAEPVDSEALYRTPVYLQELVARLARAGYHDILYVAKPPYSQTLNLTGSAEDLYFMRPELLTYLTAEAPGVRLYPIFFDTYAVRKLAQPEAYAQSLYADDTGNLQVLVRDEQTFRQLVVFYNLFNGRDFGAGQTGGFYNRVISYATLLNLQPGVLEDQHIREGLLYEGTRKTDLLTLLSLLHFARYEAAPTRTRDITLKLNPYSATLGDTPLAAQAETTHTDDRTKWNMLAFLTLVRKALNRDARYGGTT